MLWKPKDSSEGRKNLDGGYAYMSLHKLLPLAEMLDRFIRPRSRRDDAYHSESSNGASPVTSAYDLSRR